MKEYTEKHKRGSDTGKRKRKRSARFAAERSGRDFKHSSSFVVAGKNKSGFIQDIHEQEKR